MPWYDEFFKEDYLQVYSPFLTEQRTKEEVDFIEEILNLPTGSKILDLACGYGRHTIPLAGKGYDMTGLDYTEKFIQMALRSLGENSTKQIVDLVFRIEELDNIVPIVERMKLV